MTPTEQLAISIGYFSLVFTFYIFLDWRKEKTFHKDIMDRAKMLTQQVLDIKKDFEELKQSVKADNNSIVGIRHIFTEQQNQIDQIQDHLAKTRQSLQKLARNQNRLRDKMQTKTIKIEGQVPVFNKYEVAKVKQKLKEFEA